MKPLSKHERAIRRKSKLKDRKRLRLIKLSNRANSKHPEHDECYDPDCFAVLLTEPENMIDDLRNHFNDFHYVKNSKSTMNDQWQKYIAMVKADQQIKNDRT